jgi:hypothetical protein
MGIPVEVMSADEFKTGTKLDKITPKRIFTGDKHPLKQIHKKLKDLHAMSKGKLDERHKLMYDIEVLCVNYTFAKEGKKQTSTKVKAVSRLATQLATRALLERQRGIEIAEKMNKGKGKQLVGELKWEALNVAGDNGSGARSSRRSRSRTSASSSRATTTRTSTR